MHWHPPVHSPLSLRALARAGATWLARGDPRHELTALLRDVYEAAAVVLTDSGTHALQLALSAALADREDGVVALPAFSCFDLATAALGARARTVFYDLDPLTLDPDQESLRAALSVPDVTAVVVAPLFGQPAPWEWIRGETEAAGVLLVEDAAQGVGSTWEGRAAGSVGDASILSFGRGKGWTGGGGGALLLRSGAIEVALAGDPPPAAGPLLLKSAAQWLLGRPSLYGIPSRLPWLGLGETPFHQPSSPRAMSPASARLALENHEPALRAARIRRHHARALLERLLDQARSRSASPAWDERCSYLRLPARLPRGPDTFADPGTALRLGIIGSYPTPLPTLPGMEDARGTRAGAWPGADILARELVTLPTHRWIGDREVDRIGELLDPLETTVLPVQPG